MISNFIIPTIFLIIVVICALVGMKKGFVKQLSGIATFIISAFLAYKLCDAFAELIRKLPFIQSMITDIEMPDFSDAETLWDKIRTILEYIGNALQNSGDASVTANQVLNNYMAYALSYIIAFAVIFFSVWLVVKILELVITRLLNKSPLGSVNKVLGVVLGIFEGLLSTWLLSHFFASAILPWLANTYPEAFSMDMLNTVYYKIFLDFNPISLLMNWIMSW